MSCQRHVPPNDSDPLAALVRATEDAGAYETTTGANPLRRNEPPFDSRRGHACDDSCAHTISVGYVHVLTEHGGPCIPDCPHPDHE